MTETKEQVRGTREQALKRRQMQRKQALRRRRRILIASMIAIVVAIVLLVVLIVRSLGKHGDETAFTLQEDGSVTFEEVVEFDSATYNKAEMKKAVKERVNAYHGSGSVKLDSVSASKGKAYATITYDSVATYSEFTGYTAFCGTIADAREAGYTFDLTFEEVAEGHIGEIVSASDVVSDENRKVLILQENVVVHLPGDVDYITTNGINVRDAKTVEIVPVNENTDAAVAAYIIY
ncbi:MAG: hypothetical protein K6G04_05495 [Lachnospiraceae bacterium]|nr:hypothetical protein [Lachnospiraceae bacterium]